MEPPKLDCVMEGADYRRAKAPCDRPCSRPPHRGGRPFFQLTPPVPQKLRQPGVTQSGVSAVARPLFRDPACAAAGTSPPASPVLDGVRLRPETGSRL